MVELQVIGYGFLDLNTKLSDDFGINFVFTLDDITKVGSRKTSYSKTINILGSKHNNKIFDHLYEIKGQNFDYKYNKKYKCILIYNKIPVVYGYMRLTSIKKLLIENQYQIVYEINIYQELKSIFDELDKKKLSDLDFSSGFTFQGVDYWPGNYHNSDQDIGDRLEYNFDYKYVRNFGLIDYGYKLKNKIFPYMSLSKGVIYPVIYLKAVIDKIFYDIGYNYNSKFLKGGLFDGMFNHIVFIYNKKENLNNISYAAYNASYNKIDGTGNTGYNDGRPVTLFFNNTTLNGVDFNYYELDYAYYSNPGFIEGDTTIDKDAVNTLTGNTYFYNMGSSSSGIYIPEDGDYKTRIYIDVKKDEGGLFNNNDLYPTLYDIVKYNANDGNPTFTIVARWTSYDMRPNAGTTSFYFEGYSNIFNASKDESLYLHIRPGKKQGNQINVEINGVSIESIFIHNENELDYIKINEILPDITQGDLLRNVIKMFNLYIIPNNTNNKLLYIEPRDEFYNTDYLNWSSKIDYNKEINIFNLLNIVGKDVSFIFKENSLYDYIKYKEIYDVNYGDKHIYPDGDYIKDKLENKLINQTYLLNPYNTGNTFTYFPYAILRNNQDDTYYSDRKSYKLMFGFMNNVATYGFAFKLSNFWKNGVYNAYLNRMGYINNVKIIGGNTYDLNFENNINKFFINNYQSGNTLYDIFWKKSIENLIDDDSRIVEIYLKLDIQDIINLNFRRRINIDNQMYYLLKIEYDFSNPFKSSKVTLLKEVSPIYTPEYGQFHKSFLLKNDNGEYIITDDDRSRIII